jgi:hypothetical protein
MQRTHHNILTFERQYSLAHTWKKKLLTTQAEKRFRETSEKNGRSSLRKITGERVSTDEVMTFSKPSSLQTSLNVSGREIGEMSREVI